jgi:phosphatidate phosphatase PAH1
VTLPDGPLFLNPESLIHAFRKEVIDRNPEEFKIRYVRIRVKGTVQLVVITSVPDFLHFSTDPDQAMDTALVVSDLQDANKKHFFLLVFFAYVLFEGTFF